MEQQKARSQQRNGLGIALVGRLAHVLLEILSLLLYFFSFETSAPGSPGNCLYIMILSCLRDPASEVMHVAWDCSWCQNVLQDSFHTIAMYLWKMLESEGGALLTTSWRFATQIPEVWQFFCVNVLSVWKSPFPCRMFSMFFDFLACFCSTAHCIICVLFEPFALNPWFTVCLTPVWFDLFGGTKRATFQQRIQNLWKMKNVVKSVVWVLKKTNK